MDETKPWYASRAVWGSVVAIASSALLVMGHTITPDIQSALVDALALLGSSVGSLVALWGRVSATKKIGS